MFTPSPSRLRPAVSNYHYTSLAAALLLGSGLLSAASLAAEETKAAPTAPTPASETVLPPVCEGPMVRPADPRGDEEIRIKDIFAAHLPSTMRKNSFRLWVHPHLGDFDSKDFLRVSSGIRYGITKRWEAGLGSDLYFSHGLGDTTFFDRYGVASVQFSSKYNLGRSLLRNWESAVGFDYTTPVSHPPTDLTDGLRHSSPYLTFTRRLPSDPRFRIFWGVGADIVSHTRIPGELKKNDLGDSANMLTGGFVLDHRRLHYTFETIAATTRLLGHTQADELTLKPGILWELPSWHKTPNGKNTSNWVIGAAVKTVFGPDGTSYGASMKLRGNFDLKKLFRRH